MNLKLNGKNHPILIGTRVLNKLKHFAKKNGFQKIYCFSDVKLTGAREEMRNLFKGSEFTYHEIVVNAGETLKDIQSIYPIYGELLKAKADRDSVLIALGGGSIGDAGGFIASTYLRGIAWIGVPTTLLAQVDSSVGGKTGINHEFGKNLIGSFHQPELVLCDTDFLGTLSPREIASGIGEILKYAIAYDLKFFNYLDKNLGALLALDPKVTRYCIEHSLKFKVKAVQADVLDRKGVREILNFGHTFGHALETFTDHQTYQHGEAVIWGMKFAVALSLVRGHLDEKSAKKIETLLSRVPLPLLPKNLNFYEMIRAMKLDKKSSQNKVRFVLLQGIGKTVSDRNVTEIDLQKALQRIAR
jgi:3-dehydroquinate synthase